MQQKIIFGNKMSAFSLAEITDESLYTRMETKMTETSIYHKGGGAHPDSLLTTQNSMLGTSMGKEAAAQILAGQHDTNFRKPRKPWYILKSESTPLNFFEILMDMMVFPIAAFNMLIIAFGFGQ